LIQVHSNLPLLVIDVSLLTEFLCLQVVHDVSWIHAELQRWILDNLRAKWSGVVRKPEHLYDMFTGYQAQHWLTHEAVRISGVIEPGSDLATSLPQWSDETLSSVVDHFLAVRFPTVLAANKCDDAAAAANVAELQETLRLANGSDDADELGEGAVQAVVPLSARLECELQKLAKEGAISYTPLHTFREEEEGGAAGAGKKPLVIVADESMPALVTKQGAATLASAKLFGLTEVAAANESGGASVCFGSTGVREVLACAMRLRPPVLVCRVAKELSSFFSPERPISLDRD